jgi:RNA polymerase sigma factor (sigma-70 family)
MEHINLIRKIAWSFHDSTGIDWDDLFQEAAYHYLRALKSYDPSKKVSLSTYVWNFVKNELILYIRKENMKGMTPIKEPSSTVPLESISMVGYIPHPYWESLSQEAQKAASEILEHPEEFSCLDPLNARLLLRYKLLNNRWPIKNVRNALRDLKAAYSK